MNYYKKNYINTVLKFLMIYTLLAKTHGTGIYTFYMADECSSAILLKNASQIRSREMTG